MPYIAMEFVVGCSIRAYTQDPHVSTETKVGWLIDAARALWAAHKAGLVHRDAKPGNIQQSGAIAVALDVAIAKNGTTAPLPAAVGLAVAQRVATAPMASRPPTVKTLPLARQGPSIPTIPPAPLPARVSTPQAFASGPLGERRRRFRRRRRARGSCCSSGDRLRDGGRRDRSVAHRTVTDTLPPP